MSIQIEYVTIGNVLPYPQKDPLTNVVTSIVYNNGEGTPTLTLQLAPPNPNNFLPLSQVNYNVLVGWIQASTG